MKKAWKTSFYRDLVVKGQLRSLRHESLKHLDKPMCNSPVGTKVNNKILNIGFNTYVFISHTMQIPATLWGTMIYKDLLPSACGWKGEMFINTWVTLNKCYSKHYNVIV